MPTSFAAIGPMQVSAAGGQTFPDAVAGLVGGGASYTSWWGLRAYSQAKATAQANAIALRSIANSGTAIIQLTTAGVLNRAQIAAMDASSGLAVEVLYDQVGSADWPTGGAFTTRPILVLDRYGTDRHALQWVSGTVNNLLNLTTFPNTASNYIFTAFAERSSANNDSTGNVLFGSNTTAFVAGVLTDTDVQMYQDSGFLFSAVSINVNDVGAGLLWQFNGTTSNGSAINRNGSDNTFTGVGANGITDNKMGLGFTAGGSNNFNLGYASELGFMSNTKVASNTIDATKRSAITNEMNNFY